MPVVGREDEPPVELRLLPRPLFRYEADEAEGIVDGGLFAFVQGTDPQSLLVIEARTDRGTASWHFAFARLASGAVAGRLDDREVFSVAKYDFKRDPRQPFLLLGKQSVP